MAEADYYKILGVAPDSEDIVIQAAYRALMRRYHPDKNPSEAARKRTIEINAAYAVLGDPTKRTAYDARRRASASQKKASGGGGGKPPPAPPPPKTSKPSNSDLSSSEDHVRDRTGVFMFATIAVLLIAALIGLSSTGQDAAVANNTMNVDENLTTTDMFNADATNMNTDMNATDMNASMTETVPADLSKLPQTAVSYDTIEAAAQRVARVITSKGISGARSYSEGCHKAVQTTPSWDAADNCAAFDYGAAYIDATVATQSNWPKSGYFQFQSGNQADDYAAIGAPSFMTSDRLVKIRSAAQDAALEAFRTEVARMRSNQTSQSQAEAPVALGNSN